ncbi:MAG: hypothetical protein JSS60_09300 [Verrucomicrobia bacterium]|nr:hypothetical protein [Verrucomicrobiota bacterium]
MKAKKIAGIVLIIIGIVVFLLAMYAKSRVAEAKQNVQKTSGMFSENPVNKQIGGALEKQISHYDAPIMWTMIGGIVVFVIGVGTLVMCKRR